MIRKYRWIILIIAAAAAIFGIYNIIITSSFGLFKPEFSKGLNALLNSVTFALFCIVLVASIISGRSKFLISFRRGLMVVIWCLAVAVIGTVCSSFVTPKKYGDILLIAIDSIAAVLFVYAYFKRRKRSAAAVSESTVRRSAAGSGEIRYSYSVLYGALLVMLLVAIIYFILTFKVGNNFFIMAPLAATLLALVLRRVFKWRGFLLAAFIFDLMCGTVYLYGTVCSYHFAALGEVVAFTLLYLAVLLPLGDLYCRREEVA